MQSLLRLPAAASARTHRALARALSTTAQPTAGSAPHAAAAAATPTHSAAAAPAEAVDNSFLARMIAPTRSTPMFRLMNPELFVERSKKVRSATRGTPGRAQSRVLRRGWSSAGLASAAHCQQPS